MIILILLIFALVFGGMAIMGPKMQKKAKQAAMKQNIEIFYDEFITNKKGE